MLGDIFNNVLGPIMFGPSSSHTAAPTRIGNIARKIHGKEIKKANIYFSDSGSYASCYKNQGSDRGFIAGLMGYLPDDLAVINAYDIAKKNNVKFNFIITAKTFNHPNTAVIKLFSNDNSITTIESVSIGGGSFLITNIDGMDTEIDGGMYYTIIWSVEDIYLNEFSFINNSIITTYKKENSNIFIKLITSTEQFNNKEIDTIKNLNSIIKFVHIDPILPVVLNTKNVPFINSDEMKKIVKEKNITILEAAYAYEQTISGLTQEEILSKLKYILEVMESSIDEGIYNSTDKGFVFSKPTASSVHRAYMEGSFVPTGILDVATYMSISVMEANRSGKRIVAAPTAGSCGVLAATIFSLKKELNLSEIDCCNILMIAGLIGVFIYNLATFAAEDAGCQAENGSASAMAAAAIAYSYNLTGDQCLEAACLAMQNLLGLICDPIAGSVEIPCIGRNAVAISNAAVCVNMIIGGYNPYISLDECIIAMLHTGKLLPPELRCTGKGGLAITQCACKIKEKINTISMEDINEI